MKVIADFDLSALLITRSEQGMTVTATGQIATAYADAGAGSV